MISPTASRKSIWGHLWLHAVMLAAMLWIVIVILFVNALVPTPAAESHDEFREGIGTKLFQGSYFKPEPAERTAYIASCLSLGLVIVAGCWAFCFVSDRPWVHAALTISVGMWWAGVIYFWCTIKPWDSSILWPAAAQFCWRAMAMAAVAVAAVLGLRRVPRRLMFEYLAEIFAVILCAALACYQITSGELDIYSVCHLEPIVFPLTQVTQGRTILVDTESVYGLYPHFVEPIFHLLPLSLASFSLMMVALVFCSLWWIYRFLRLIVGNPLVAWIGFLGYLFGPFTTLNLPYPYYQNYPLRTFFPAMTLWLGARYINWPSRRRLILLGALSGWAVLWNLDSGIACVGAALVLVVGREMVQRELWSARIRAALWGGCAIAGSASVAMLVFLAYLFLRSGHLPDIGRLAGFQKVFYVSGFLMEPMEPYGVWWLVVGVYVAALTGGIAAVFGHGSKRLGPIYLMLGVLGAGLFAYFQGRSVIPNLYYSACPAFLVLAVFFGDLVRKSRAWSWNRSEVQIWMRNVVQFSELAAVAFAICLLIVTIVMIRGRFGRTSSWHRYRTDYQHFKEEWQQRTAAVNRSLKGQDPHTPVLVLSGRDYMWYLFLRRPSVLSNAGFNHIFLRAEIDDLCQLLEARRAPVVVWDATYLQSPLPNYGYGYVSPEERERLLDVLKRRYEKQEEFSGRDDLPLSVWIAPHAK